MSRIVSPLLVTLALLFGMTVALPGPAMAKKRGNKKGGIEKPVSVVISAVRYGKDDLALKQMAGDAQAKFLLAEHYEKATQEERAEFAKLFHTLFAGLAFPKIRQNFEHLETILYADPKIEGDTGSVESTLLILHPVKKQEIKVRYDLVKDGGKWKVLDVQVLGTGRGSMLTNIRDEQVQPLIKDGGVAGLLTMMRQRAAEIATAAE